MKFLEITQRVCLKINNNEHVLKAPDVSSISKEQPKPKQDTKPQQQQQQQQQPKPTKQPQQQQPKKREHF